MLHLGRLLEGAGRGVRLTDPALVLAEHARTESRRCGRGRRWFRRPPPDRTPPEPRARAAPVALRVALPAMHSLARSAPRLWCELIEAEPEWALPALALGDIDLVLGDEWKHQPWRLSAALQRYELFRDPVYLLSPARHPAARRYKEAVPLAELAGDAWSTGHPGMAWEAVTQRTCREYGGFDPDIRHRTNDATVSLGLVSRGLAVTLLPDLVLGGRNRNPGVALRRIADGPVDRRILAVTRTTDAARPSTQALIGAVRDAAAATGRARQDSTLKP